ncbi:speriolin-like protein [Boleophthalmus pectinirostris]|uniref:speriolin-like protein n=1 Tax=Boleophthalmus pectinirostris TaxID=150288 RepID=UPI0024322DB3|nr:speriolin-like protein [Boleophthalmus pectinirostris]
MESILLRNEKLVRENENLKISMRCLINENNRLTSNLQRTDSTTPEGTTLPIGSPSFTRVSNQQSIINEEQFKAGLQPHRTSSPDNLKTLFESLSYVESKDTGFGSQDHLGFIKEQREKLLGEIAYQLDWKILCYIFRSNKRFYGYTVTNIPSKITEVSTHPLTGKVDEAYRHHLNERYEKIKEILSRKGYKITLHPQFSEFIVNTYGILQTRPALGSSQEVDYLDPNFLRSVIETTAPLKLQKDLVLLLECLHELAVMDEKPLLLW